MSFLVIAGFEAAQRLRRPATWIYFGLFLVMAFLFFIIAAGAFPRLSVGFGTGGKVMVNSPHTLATIVAGIGFFGLLVTARLAGTAVQQDFEHRTYPLLFTRPISRLSYLGGRFVGVLLALAVVQCGPVLGCLLGSVMPFVDGKVIGPQHALGYLGPLGILLLPTAASLGAIFFAIGSLTRSTRPVLVTGVMLLMGTLLAGVVGGKLENKLLAALIDPFGNDAFERLTEYWTVAEKNGRLIPLGGVLLANRLLWLAVGAAALAVTYLRFRLGEPLARAGARAVPEEAPPVVAALGPSARRTPPLRLLPRLSWLAFRETVRSVSFLLVTATGVAMVVITVRLAGAAFGTETYPVTGKMIELGAGSFSVFLLSLVTVYTGQLAWRERDVGVEQILDALPVPTWVFYVSKLAALMMVGVLLELVVMATGIGLQIAAGYHHFELGLYAGDLLGLRLVEYFQVAALALFLQTVVNHKQLGQFAMVLFFATKIGLPLAGLEHNLYRYGGDPGYRYSDMNGYGHFLGPWGWFNLYWTLAAVALALVSARLWPRGQETALRLRARAAFQGWRGKWALVLTAVAFAGVGAFIFYNTNVLNPYRTASDGKKMRVDYERRFKPLEKDPQPRITAVQVHFDLHPETNVLRVKGTYQLENRSGQPIPRVHVNLAERVEVQRLAFGGVERPSETSLEPRFSTFTLPRPLGPGETTTAEFELTYAPHGFGNEGADVQVMGNGTFVNNGVLPLLGYEERGELQEDAERRKWHLAPKVRMRDLDDANGRQSSYLGDDADRLTLSASVCTSADQLAVLPGRLQREWREGDRRCFAYASERPVLNLFAVLSARFAVRRDRWKDVALEVDYHPGHEYNVDRMMAAMKAALEYCSSHFGPYQAHELRIVEFPRYQSFAQSLPSTIPYSESIGFIARVKPGDPDDVDYPYYVTAHEVAHQWWAHQVIGANVQGATLLSESLAQYSALMVMKAAVGAGQMRRFLRYELDAYLRGRAGERQKELPLLRVENQGYIHYRKASLVFYALQDAIGEAAVNQALRAMVQAYAFRGPPYPTARDLLRELEAVTPPDRRGLLKDLFETITLYENRVLEARATPVAGGQWEVTVKVAARKLRADELGVETEVKDFAEPIEVGAVGDAGQVLHATKVIMGPGEHTVTFRMAERPRRAGIDPSSILIDRKPDDNLMTVDVASKR